MVSLISVDFLVQIHDLPSGLILKDVARQFGKFIGTFLDYDTKLIGSGYRVFLWIRVRLDIWGPLKRRKKIILGLDRCFYACFQY